MNKTKVFLDSNIIISYFEDIKEVKKLFSKKILNKVQYIINPIVYQEVLLVSTLFKKKIEFKIINNYINLVPIDASKMEPKLKDIKEFKNLAVHSNDILLILSAIDSSCEYFLTLDKSLIAIGKMEPLKILAPGTFLDIMGVH